MKKLFIALLAVVSGLGTLDSSAQNATTVADGTQTNFYVPIEGMNADAFIRSQIIYPASFLLDLQGSEISSLRFYLDDVPNWTASYQVRMGVVASESFPSNDFIGDTSTLVYAGVLTVAPDSTLTIQFPLPFNYQGGNLMLEFSTLNSGDFGFVSFYGISMPGASVEGNSPVNVSDVSPVICNFLPKTTFFYTGGATCMSPVQIEVTATASAAAVSWTRRSEGTFEVGVSTLDTNTPDVWIPVTDTSYTFSGLLSGMAYRAYVRTDCGGEYSAARTQVFHTECDAVTDFPWFEGFEEAWIADGCFGQNNARPACWRVYDGGVLSSLDMAYKWMKNDHASRVFEGSGSAVCYTDEAEGRHNDWLITPKLALTGSQQLRFYVRNNTFPSDETEEISVWISDADAVLTAPASDTAALPGFTQLFQTAIPNGPFTFFEISLAGYTGNRHLAFVRREEPNNGWFLCLDNVTVEQIPDCERPHGLESVATTSSTALLKWETDAPAVNVYYKPAAANSFAMFPDAVLDADSLFELDGLLPGQEYVWYVEGVCSDSAVLASVAQPLFVTACAPMGSLPYTWNMEDNLAGGDASFPLPTCWTRFDTQYPHIYHYPFHAYNGQRSLYAASSSPVLVALPEVDTNIFAISDLQISFFAKNHYSTAAVIEVGVLTDPADTSTFVVIDSVTNIYSFYTEHRIALSGFVGTAGLVALRLTSGQYSNPGSPVVQTDPILLDEVVLSEIPNCPRPENVSAVSLSPDGATLQWQSEETLFRIYIKRQGDEAYLLFNDDVVTDTFYTLSDLQADADYSVYVSSVCSGGGENPSLPVSFHTPCQSLTELPYVVDFEDGEDTGNYLPACWMRGSADSLFPYVSQEEAYSGSYALYFGNTNTVAMPGIDADVLDFSFIRLSFYAKTADNSVGTLKVGVMTHPTDPASFVQVGDDIPVTTVYQPFEVDLSAYTGSGVYVAFRTLQYMADIYVDNVVLDSMPGCVRPTVTAVAPGSTQATISWNGDAGHQSWQVVIGPSDADPDSLDAEEVTMNTHTFTNLTPNTPYHAFVRAVCDGGLSEWSHVCSFHTLWQDSDGVPFFCDFENEEQNNGWMLMNGSQVNRWHIGTAANHTAGGTRALYISSDSGVSNTYQMGAYSSVWAFRDFSFSDASDFRLTFDYRCVGDAEGDDEYDFLSVYIGDPVSVAPGLDMAPEGAHLLGTFYLQPAWTTVSIPLQGQYSGSVKRLYFLWSNDDVDGSNPPAALDNISIEEIACASPLSLAVSEVTAGSALLVIQPANEYDSEWQVKINDSLMTVQSTEIQLTDLLPSTLYTLSARTVCAGGDTSLWTQASYFQTLCLPIVEVPQWWDFEGELHGGTDEHPLPVCWGRVSPEGAPFPYVDGFGYAYSGDYCLNFYNMYPNTFAVLPELDTDSLNLQDLQLTFYSMGSSPALGCLLEVGVMTDPEDGTTFTAVHSFSPGANYTGDPVVVPFSGYTGAGRYIAFKNVVTGTSYSSFYVDDVLLERIPTCPPPTGLSVSEVSGSSASVSWNQSGNASLWRVEYGLNGFEPGTGAVVTATTNEVTLENLASGTLYTVYVTADCGEGDISSPVSLSFTLGSVPTDSCAAPRDLSVSDITDTEATVSWTPGGEETEWYLQYKSAEDADWSADIFCDTTSYTLTDLAASTTYFVRVQAECPDSSSPWTAPVALTTTGVRDHLADSIALFPNPANSMLHVQWVVGNESATIELLDVYGKRLQTIPVTGEITTVNVSGLADGMYFVRVTTEQGAVTKSFVKR